MGPLGVKCNNFFLYLNYTVNTCTSPYWLLFVLACYIKKNAGNPDGARCVLLEIVHNLLILFTLYQKACKEV